MKTKYYFLAAILGMTFASCSNEEYVGDNSPTLNANDGDGSIQFGYKVANTTRADHVGADAASLLSGKFIVGGFKGSYSAGDDLEDVAVETGKVFDNYIVNWTANTAGKTESNTSDWEYVGIIAAAPSGIAGNKQSIKYWDYSASQYDFIAYSTGSATVTAEGTAAEAIAANKVKVTAITPTTATTSAYTLSGKAADLAKCYIADMVTVYKDGTDNMHYQDEVQLTFRSLATKVRMAIYETVPGYSVKDVYFYTDDATSIATGPSDNEEATLFTCGGAQAKNHFYTEGTYTVYFPTIGKTNVTPTKVSDYNKAHADFAVVGSGKTTTKTFGELQKVGKDYREAAVTQYIGRSSDEASFAGTTEPYYQIAMPNEEGTVLELRVDYTLVSIDGSGEEITVHGATAFVPATYAQWKSNYAYTYIFKISDNSNGWTSTVDTDPAGLYPITFDAIVVDSEEHTQSTITNVATPSITTYQKGHVYTDGPEYEASGKIYVQVYWDGAAPALRENLGSKGQLYKLSDGTATEAEVMDALNLQVAPTGAYEVTGRNGLSLDEVSSDATIAAVPGPDGNDIPVTPGTAAEFTPTASTTYAYVYDTETYAGDYYPVKPADWDAKYNTDYYTNAACTTHPSSSFSANTYYKKTSVIGSYNEFTTAAPEDWQNDASNPYYSDNALTTQITGTYASKHTFVLDAKPADWDDGVYYSNDACTTPAPAEYTNGTYYKIVKCYRKYTVNNKVYGVKVIKVD